MKKIVSILIPCRNEEKYIGKCLKTVLNQDYPIENLEVLVVDGMSEDNTKKIVEEISKKNPSIKLLENPKKFTNFSLNIGLKEASGDYIMLMGCHAEYEKKYISKCVKYIEEYGADNVGCIIKTLPANQTASARAIANCMSTFFGAMSLFRVGLKKPREADTVFGDFYRKEVFNRIGYFNEKLQRSQDMEFNLRLRKAGGKIFLFPDLVAYYFASATLQSFLRHNFLDGIWVTYPLKFGIRIFKIRHLLPLFLVAGSIVLVFLGLFFLWAKVILIFCFAAYLAIALISSLKISLKDGFKVFILMPIVFLIRHFGYGLGSLWGIIKVLT